MNVHLIFFAIQLLTSLAICASIWVILMVSVILCWSYYCYWFDIVSYSCCPFLPVAVWAMLHLHQIYQSNSRGLCKMAIGVWGSNLPMQFEVSFSYLMSTNYLVGDDHVNIWKCWRIVVGYSENTFYSGHDVAWDRSNVEEAKSTSCFNKVINRYNTSPLTKLLIEKGNFTVIYHTSKGNQAVSFLGIPQQQVSSHGIHPNKTLESSPSLGIINLSILHFHPDHIASDRSWEANSISYFESHWSIQY